MLVVAEVPNVISMGGMSEVDDKTIRVMIVDDHYVVRRGLADLLATVDDVNVVGLASDGEEAVALAVEERPEVVLMDISMPGMDGIETTRRLLTACPDSKVVMLTSFSGRDYMVDAMEVGAVGYLLKDSDPDVIVKGIRAAVAAP